MTECYCEAAFLSKFLDERSKCIYNDDEITLWCNFKSLFFKHISAVDNISDIDELFKGDKEKLTLWQKKRYSEEGIKEKQIDDFNFATINPHTVFLLSNTQKCKQLEEEYGMLFISNETKKENAEILFGYEQSAISVIPNGNYSNYLFLSSFQHPCNAIIVNDAYLLSEKDKTYDDNLIAILDLLLPKKLNKTIFQLLILSGDGVKNIDVNHKYSLIKSRIDKLRTYKIELKIITKKAHHNRDIITNYLRINAKHKFTLFIEKKAATSDDLTVHNFIGKGSEMAVVKDRKEDYKKIEKDTQNIGTQIVVMPKEQNGIISNRLLQ